MIWAHGGKEVLVVLGWGVKLTLALLALKTASLTLKAAPLRLEAAWLEHSTAQGRGNALAGPEQSTIARKLAEAYLALDAFECGYELSLSRPTGSYKRFPTTPSLSRPSPRLALAHCVSSRPEPTR